MARLLVPALIALCLGIFAAFVHLALQPVPQLTPGQLQAAADLPRVHWVRGSDSPSLSYSRLRRDLPPSPGPVTITEGDLNTWLRSEFIPALNAANQGISPVKLAGWTATQPNFRITENELIFSVTWQFTRATAEKPRQILHQFFWSPGDAADSWQLSGGFIGNFPIDALPGLTRLIWARMMHSWWSDPSLQPLIEVIATMDSIALERGKIHFVATSKS